MLYSCLLCNKTYKRIGNFKNHLIKKHNISLTNDKNLNIAILNSLKKGFIYIHSNNNNRRMFVLKLKELPFAY